MKEINSVLAVTAVAAVVSACGGGGGLAPYDLSSIGTTTAISTTSDGGKAADAVLGQTSASSTVNGQSSNGMSTALGYLGSYGAPALDSNKILSSLGNAAAPLSKALQAPMAAAAPQLDAMRAGSLSQAPTTTNCTGGGTITVDSTNNLDSNGYGTASLTLTADNCVDTATSTATNGTLSLSLNASSSSASLTLTTGNGDNVIDASDLKVITDPYGGLGIVTDISSIKFVLSASGSSSSSSASVNITASGISNTDDAYFNTYDKNTMDSVSMDMSISGTSTSTTYDTTLNGRMDSESGALGGSATNASTMAYSLFNVNRVYDSSNVVTTSMNGSMAKQTTPTACGDGVFNVVTNTPIKYDYNTFSYTAGQVTINDNTVVTFGASGVTVTVDGVAVTGSSGSLCFL